jgi:hypothetical protein
MSPVETSHNSLEDTFSLIVDQYGRVWLNAKLEGLPVTIDLGDKVTAFEIMAATMSDHDFEYRPVRAHEPADNDDQQPA